MAKDKKKTAAQPLNEKQLAFCREYIIDFNQTQAAIRAGYSEKTAAASASRMLTNVKISTEIKRLIEKRAERTGITADRVVEQLAKIAFMDIKDIVDWGVEERQYHTGAYDIKEIDGKEVAAPVMRTEFLEYVRPKDPDQVDGTLIQSVKMGKYGFVIEIPDRMRAMEMLAKHTGVFDDRPQVAVDIKGYVNALWNRVEGGDVWDGFDNGGPDPGGDDNGSD